MRRGCYSILFLLLIKSNLISQPVFYSDASRHWADSVLGTMNYYEKIGQLFIADAFSNRDSLHAAHTRELVEKYHIGGIMFLQGGPVRQIMLTNEYQQCAKIPLIISLDAEWGLSMRLDSTIRFPRQMTLGAAGDDSMVYKLGREIGRQCKRIGVQLNFAPDVDINNNPLNPVINSRSFGEDKKQVARMGLMYMKGMQDEGILACAKHFPGHGNADADSHFSLPVIKQDSAEIDSVELYPFKELIKNKVAGVMAAHLFIPTLDSTAELPATLSAVIVNGLLKNKLGFEGLVFTDALNMKAVAAGHSPGELEVKALLAGNDMLLYSENIPLAIEGIHHAIQECDLEQNAVDDKVRKILRAKYFAGLNHLQLLDTNHLYADLHTDDAAWMNYQMYEYSITTLQNKKNILPLHVKNERVAAIELNDTINNTFQQMLSQYARVDCYGLNREADPHSIDSLFEILKHYDYVIVSLHNTSTNASRNFNVNENLFNMVQRFSELKHGIFCAFGNSYVVTRFTRLNDYDALVLSYEDTYLPQYLTAQCLFGAIQTKGHLPVSPTTDFRRGDGTITAKSNCLKFTLSQELNIDPVNLRNIDTLIHHAIADTVFPGCQVLAAMDGKVFYNRSFGYHTYNDSIPVKNSDLYDIASVSKIASTALAAMLLYERKKIDLHAKISKYLPELKKSNKKDIVLLDMLAHQSGLKSWIPFYKNTLVNGKLNDALYHHSPDSIYSLQVGDSLWLRSDYADTIWNEIIQSPLETPGKYVYSDLGMLIMQRIIEKITGKKLNEFTEENFYQPLGLTRTLYHPLECFDTTQIIPTENDTAFRHQLVHGYVHDPAAAMLGGVAGNAGVFSNAQGLAVIMQMLLNGGTYNGKRFLKKETIDLFTHTAFSGTENRRGIIFDKPETDIAKGSPAAAGASPLAFGHTGFTGTCAWADLKNKLVYIFLSNRVNPSAENNKLAKQNIRTNVMQIFYDALKK